MDEGSKKGLDRSILTIVQVYTVNNEVSLEDFSFSEQFDMYSEIKEAIKQFDLPKIPLNVAVYYESLGEEERKDFSNINKTLREVYAGNISGSRDKVEVYEWVEVNPEIYTKLIVNIEKGYGYQLDDMKYNVITIENEVVFYLYRDMDGQIRAGNDLNTYLHGDPTYQLTESEVYHFDKKYMAFAKPINQGEKEKEYEKGYGLVQGTTIPN